MAISVLVQYEGEHTHDRITPVFGIVTYRKYIEPACEELGLKWVPRFKPPGFELLPEVKKIPEIIKELEKLRDHIAALSMDDIPVSVREPLVVSTGKMIAELEKIKEDARKIEFARVG